METIGMRILYAYKEINQSIKRIFPGTAWTDNPEEFIPNSYKTRIRDNEDVPREEKFFKYSYKMLKCSEASASTRSFHLEYLHRSLNSRTKHEAMNMVGADAFCVHCTCLSSSSHVLNDCILAKITQKTITEFCRHKGYKQDLLADETYLSFLWWDPKIMDYDTFKQIWLVWIETRRHIHQVDFLPRFNRLGPLQFAAKAATAFRRAAEVAHFLRLQTAQELCDFAQESAQNFQTWSHQLLYDRRRFR